MPDSKNILIVTGSYSVSCSKQSYFGQEIYEAFKKIFLGDIDFFNGGTFEYLHNILNDIKKYKVIVWMPDIDNSYNKFLQSIKVENRTAILIQSKINDYNKYSTFQIVERMFKAHSNICLEISKVEVTAPRATYKFRILDPLGNVWYDGSSITESSMCIASRVEKLLSYHRYPSTRLNDPIGDIDIDPQFIKAVRSFGWRFSNLISGAINKERFLGNASTRCMRGFPAIRCNSGIYISRRNVDKETIDEQDFVPVFIENNEVVYSGMNKPSVDAAVQTMLFDYYHSVNYIIHGHVYVHSAPFTKKHIPCGYIEEFDEVILLKRDHRSFDFSVNLTGHGCLILAKNFEYIASIGMSARDFPEYLTSRAFD